MIRLNEYLLSKSKYSKMPSMQKATDENIHEMVKDALDKYGHDADLNFIDTSEVTDMTDLFSAKVNGFHQKALGMSYIDVNPDISEWDVSNVIKMNYMFWHTDEFNCDISKWNVGKVKEMEYMFCFAKKFNSNISEWNVDNATTMKGMFSHAFEFNSDISKWDTKNVYTMEYMFNSATAFNQDLRNWKALKRCDASEMFDNCGIHPSRKPVHLKYY